jgi:hypothetical protein
MGDQSRFERPPGPDRHSRRARIFVLGSITRSHTTGLGSPLVSPGFPGCQVPVGPGPPHGRASQSPKKNGPSSGDVLGDQSLGLD